MDITTFISEMLDISKSTNNPDLIPRIKVNNLFTDINQFPEVIELGLEKNKKGNKIIRRFLDLDGGARIDTPIPRDRLYFKDRFLTFLIKNSRELPEPVKELDVNSGTLTYYIEFKYGDLRSDASDIRGVIYKTKRGRLKPFISIDYSKGIVNSKYYDDNPTLVYYFINYLKI